MIRGTWHALFSPHRRTLTAFVAVLVLCAIVATASGYWLLFRASYVIAFGIPVAFAIAWFNTRW